ncbi:hypothetical protein ABK040_006305 [Willaertia magna]
MRFNSERKGENKARNREEARNIDASKSSSLIVPRICLNTTEPSSKDFEPLSSNISSRSLESDSNPKFSKVNLSRKLDEQQHEINRLKENIEKLTREIIPHKKDVTNSEENNAENNNELNIEILYLQNVEIKEKLDNLTLEKSKLEEQFVNQVQQMEKLFSKIHTPPNNNATTNSAPSSDKITPRLTNSFIQNISPIKKSAEISNNRIIVEEKEETIQQLRSKITEIKTKYESEKKIETKKEEIKNEISSLMEKLILQQGLQTERTKKLTNSLSEYLTKTSKTVEEKGTTTDIDKYTTELKKKLSKKSKKLKSLKKTFTEIQKIVENLRKEKEHFILHVSKLEAHVCDITGKMKQQEEIVNNANKEVENLKNSNQCLLKEKEDLIQQIILIRESIRNYKIKAQDELDSSNFIVQNNNEKENHQVDEICESNSLLNNVNKSHAELPSILQEKGNLFDESTDTVDKDLHFDSDFSSDEESTTSTDDEEEVLENAY